MRFYIVDAFTDALFGGNPAGVVILNRGADFPEDEIMRNGNSVPSGRGHEPAIQNPEQAVF